MRRARRAEAPPTARTGMPPPWLGLPAWRGVAQPRLHRGRLDSEAPSVSNAAISEVIPYYLLSSSLLLLHSHPIPSYVRRHLYRHGALPPDQAQPRAPIRLPSCPCGGALTPSLTWSAKPPQSCYQPDRRTLLSISRSAIKLDPNKFSRRAQCRSSRSASQIPTQTSSS